LSILHQPANGVAEQQAQVAVVGAWRWIWPELSPQVLVEEIQRALPG
jgi:hypothetical protein